MKDNIKHFKLSTGEEIICEVVQWDTIETSAILIRKAMKLQDSVNIRNGYKFFSFRPWLSFNDDPNTLQSVNAEHVVGESTPSPDLYKLYTKSLSKLNEFLKEKPDLDPIDLDHLDDLTDDEVHEYIEQHLDQQEAKDSDKASNILQFPKTFH